MLSLALLPIGVIAVLQAQNVASKARVNVELALLALTEQAAMQERLAINQAFGTEAVLALLLPDLATDTARCVRFMRSITDANQRFEYAGFVTAEGRLECASDGQARNLSASEEFQELVVEPRRLVTATPFAQMSGGAVLSVITPVFTDSGTGEIRLLGFVLISIPHSGAGDEQLIGTETALNDALLDLVTFNARGMILSSSNSPEAVENMLPAGTRLADMTRNESRATSESDRDGDARIYTVAPIERNRLYVMGIWDGQASLARQTDGTALSTLFPALMWVVSLGVALFAVHTLVLRHLTRLGRQMALFAAARRLPAETPSETPPTEIQRIQRAFLEMTDALIRDEASLENAVREKSVLVKEIHHRVKNNLQLISSIISLQIRTVEGSEAKHALRQTQDRVLSMATIHRDLYQTSETGLVDVTHLVHEVVTKSIETAPDGESIELDLQTDDIRLFPDQAVPMSLLASEAVINAIKHMPPLGTPGIRRRIEVELREDAERNCLFRLSNTTLEDDGPRPQSKGMGRKLMRAFATQLGAKIDAQEHDGVYRLTVEFKASEFSPAPGTF
ncbi:sensor histidine kinase [uncultured Jannaschia sp.]|uniref:sensor histidine kinase n=1 Tax=uncultured Jannaschia sp. TaxID=293347 RepID=UPI00262DDB84|nr:sensor histidine kinase [uncultured Jannaschia sp.]